MCICIVISLSLACSLSLALSLSLSRARARSVSHTLSCSLSLGNGDVDKARLISARLKASLTELAGVLLCLFLHICMYVISFHNDAYIHVCMYIHTYVHTCYVLTNPPIPSSHCKHFVFLSPNCFLLHKRTNQRVPPCNDLKNTVFQVITS